MNPEDYRQLLTSPGTPVSLIGDDAPPQDEWSHGEKVVGVLASYIIVERHHVYGKQTEETIWDTAAIVHLDTSLQTSGWGGEYCGDRLLIYHRHPDFAWDSDCIVFVFGIRQGESLGEGPVPLATWMPKTVMLAGFALLTVQDGSKPNSQFTELEPLIGIL